MNTFQLYQTMFCFGQIISIDSNSFGVGLSINQLNNIKHQFDQVNNVKSKAAINKGIYQNKYHNFSEKFSLEDRLLLVRLYNRYTEENCMTFKTFARKFKRKANEWINSNNEETMWEHEHIRKQKSLKLFDGMEGFQDFTDLESFTEEELLELLQSLENDEMLNEIENQIQSQSSIDNDSLSTEDDDETLDNIFANETNASDAQRQGQEQSQQVRAEIHTHNHYYLIQQQDGSIQVSEYADTNRLYSLFCPGAVRVFQHRPGHGSGHAELHPVPRLLHDLLLLLVSLQRLLQPWPDHDVPKPRLPHGGLCPGH